MIDSRCAYCYGPLNLARAGAKFCSQKCGTYYRRRTLPRELTSRARWVRWSKCGSRKMPVSASTGRAVDVTDSASWSPYKVAQASPHGDGLGFALSAEDDISCVDLDGALVDGVLSASARRVIEDLPGVFMVEVSPSGHGVHAWHRGPSGAGTNRVEGSIRVERYSQDRFLTVTGLRISL